MNIDMSKSKEIFGEEAQLAALSENVHNLAYIDNPSEEVQLAAVCSKDGQALQYIHNPSEAVQLEAVKQDEHALALIANPSKRVIAAALAKHPKAAEYVKASWPAT